MTKKYAISDNVPQETDYLTSGKKYEITSGNTDGFCITSDNATYKEDVVCLRINCRHLNGGDWTIIEEEE